MLFILDAAKILDQYNIVQNFKNDCINLFLNSKLKNFNIFILIFLGQKTFLSNDMKNTLLQSGIWHIFIISGAHLSIISKTLNLIKVPYIINITIIILYTAIIDFSLPQKRALLTILLPLKKKTLWAFWFLMCYDIQALENLGFVLSFLNIYFLYLLRNNKNFFLNAFKLYILNSILNIYFFNCLQPYGLLNNIVIVPIYSFIIIPCIFISMILFIININSNLILQITDVLIGLTIEWIKYFNWSIEINCDKDMIILFAFTMIYPHHRAHYHLCALLIIYVVNNMM